MHLAKVIIKKNASLTEDNLTEHGSLYFPRRKHCCRQQSGLGVLNTCAVLTFTFIEREDLWVVGAAEVCHYIHICWASGHC